jgi:hypothetical protein
VELEEIILRMIPTDGAGKLLMYNIACDMIMKRYSIFIAVFTASSDLLQKFCAERLFRHGIFVHGLLLDDTL